MGGIRPAQARGPWVGSVIAPLEVTGAANVGAGTGLLFRDEIAHILNFRTLSQGTGISISTVGDIVTISSTLYSDIYWRTPVINFFDPSGSLPVGPSVNDQYIATATANGWTAQHIYKWNGAIWEDTAPIRGMTCQNDNWMYGFSFDGTHWIATINQWHVWDNRYVEPLTGRTGAHFDTGLYGCVTVGQYGIGTGELWPLQTRFHVQTMGTDGTDEYLRKMQMEFINSTGTKGGYITIYHDYVTPSQPKALDDIGTYTFESRTVGGASPVKYGYIRGIITDPLTVSASGKINIGITANAVETDFVTITSHGVGVMTVPSNWDTTVGRDFKVLQVGKMSIESWNDTGVYSSGALTCNAYYDQTNARWQFMAEKSAGQIKFMYYDNPTFSQIGFLLSDVNGSAGSAVTWREFFRLICVSGIGVLNFAYTGENIDVVFGLNANHIASADWGLVSWQFYGCMQVLSVADNTGAPYEGGATVETATAIDVSKKTSIRLQNSTGTTCYFILTGANSHQVLFVYNESPTPVITGGEVRILIYPGGPYLSIWPTYSPVQCGGAIIVWNPFLNTLGSWTLFNQYPHNESFTLTETAAPGIQVDASTGNRTYTVTIAGNKMLGNPTNPRGDGEMLIFRIKQGAGGTHLLTYDSKYRFSTDIPVPVLSTAAGAIDYLGFIYNVTDDKWDLIALVKGF